MQHGLIYERPYRQVPARGIRLILGFDCTIWMICWYELVLACAVNACMPSRR